MKLTEGHISERMAYIVALVIFVQIGLTIYLLSVHEAGMQSKDIDGDGEDELVTETTYKDGTTKRIVLESDGTMYVTVYDEEGKIMIRWKYVPDPTNKEKYYYYVWDEEAGEWRLDQDRDGIPDKNEKSSNREFFARNCGWVIRKMGRGC